jgi:hypothetical protein
MYGLVNNMFYIEAVGYLLATITAMIAGERMPAVFTNMF